MAAPNGVNPETIRSRIRELEGERDSLVQRLGLVYREKSELETHLSVIEAHAAAGPEGA